MALLVQTTPHYIRCVKPNAAQAAKRLSLPMVLEQLRCAGTQQLLMLMGNGFPTRCEFDYFAARYRPLLPRLPQSLSARDFVQARRRRSSGSSFLGGRTVHFGKKRENGHYKKSSLEEGPVLVGTQ
eukprot:6209624-Pleurochrysis_carterae.AAC.1